MSTGSFENGSSSDPVQRSRHWQIDRIHAFPDDRECRTISEWTLNCDVEVRQPAELHFERSTVQPHRVFGDRFPASNRSWCVAASSDLVHKQSQRPGPNEAFRDSRGTVFYYFAHSSIKVRPKFCILTISLIMCTLADLDSDHYTKRLGPVVRVPDTAKSTNRGAQNHSLRWNADAHATPLNEMPRSVESSALLSSYPVHDNIPGWDLRNRRPPRSDSAENPADVPRTRPTAAEYQLQCEQNDWFAAGLGHVRVDSRDALWAAI